MQRDWIEQIYLETLGDIFSKKKRTPTAAEINKAIKKTFPNLTKTTEKDVKKQAKIVLKNNRSDIRQFKKNLLNRWSKAFDLSEIFISYNLDHGMIVCDSFRSKNKHNVKFEIILRLHARSCQIALEVLELLKAGYADGALARWRSLYELSIFANFLSDKPEETAQKYLDYSIVECHHEKIEFQKNCKKLGYKPISKREMNKSEIQLTFLKEKYGKEFIKSYGWAADHLLPNKRHFAGLEETIAFSHMRSHYKFANNYIHGGAKGFLYKLGTYTQDKVMLAGPSNYGLADPGQNTAYSLFHSTLALFEFESYLEDTLFIKISENMVSEISHEFMRIQKQIESEEKSR